MSWFCSYFVAYPVFICLCGLFCPRGSECSDQLFVHLVKMICAVVLSAERNQISALDTGLDVWWKVFSDILSTWTAALILKFIFQQYLLLHLRNNLKSWMKEAKVIHSLVYFACRWTQKQRLTLFRCRLVWFVKIKSSRMIAWCSSCGRIKLCQCWLFVCVDMVRVWTNQKTQRSMKVVSQPVVSCLGE